MKLREVTLLAGSAAVLVLGAAAAWSRDQGGSQVDPPSTSDQADTAGQGPSAATQSGTSTTPGADARDGAAIREAAAPDGPAPVVMLLVPANQSATTTEAMQSGCWARIYGAQGYTGDVLTLIGPLDMPRTTGAFGVDWNDKVRSIEVGPNATLTVYDDDGFRDPITRLEPGRRAAEVSERAGLFDEFESLRLACRQSG